MTTDHMIDVGKLDEGDSNDDIYKMSLACVETWTLPRSAAIVDIGGGVGNFAKLLLDRFDCVKVVDHAKRDIDPRIFYHAFDLNVRWDMEDSAVDAVVSLEVIEHLENPRHFFREIQRILKPGGVGLITTPNQLSLASKSSLLGRGYFRDFSDNCYPAHITALVKKDIYRIINEVNLQHLKTYFTGRGRMPFLRDRWQTIFPFLSGEAFSDNIGIHFLKPFQ